MRPCHCTLSSAAVHADFKAVLARTLSLPRATAALSADQLLDLLIFLAATARTLFAIVRTRFTCAVETARTAVRATVPDVAVLTEQLAEALHAVAAFGRLDRRRRWVVAIDTHFVPWYGDPDAPGVSGGPRKAGTSRFHVYATAALIHRRRRFTVGLCTVAVGVKPHAAVGTLLDQIAARGLTVAGVVLDAGFGGGDTIRLLQDRGVSYTVPLQRTGKQDRRSRWFDAPSGTVGEVSWTTKKAKLAVTTAVLVWRSRGQTQSKVYAFAGWGSTPAVSAQTVSAQRRAWLARRRYRQRFGIETSYRQKNQARAWTTSADPAYRLLLEGLAHLLRQVWVRQSGELARAGGLRPTAWVSGLPFADLLEGWAEWLRGCYPRADGPVTPAVGSRENTA